MDTAIRNISDGPADIEHFPPGKSKQATNSQKGCDTQTSIAAQKTYDLNISIDEIDLLKTGIDGSP
ncbi:MAG: hypothetical protein JNK97_16705 [Zoogloea sp.]|nr:hypothetical protein [Zoogloea sp.]